MRRTAVPGDLVRVVAKGDERYADIGTVYAIPDEDDVIVEFDALVILSIRAARDSPSNWPDLCCRAP